MDISIIFVTWAMNEERAYLAQYSILSLINSLNSTAEIIIIDNGGRDDVAFFESLASEGRISMYLRNSKNIHFGPARNQGIKLASGKYIAIVDNDLSYTNNWLEACVDALAEHPDKKLIASPIDYPTGGLRERYDAGELLVKGKKYRLNMRAGSNCMVMRREIFDEVGMFKQDVIAGTKFTDVIVRAGYLTAVTPKQMAIDLGLRKGYNFSEEFDFSGI